MIRSAVVRVEDFEFVASAPAVWQLPPDGNTAHVSLGLQITNRAASARVLCLLDTVRVSLAGPRGQKPEFDGGRNAIRPGPQTRRLAPDEAITITFASTLRRTREDATRLTGPDNYGGIWYLDGLSPGVWSLRILYDSTGSSTASCWKGRAATEPLRVHFR